MKTALVAVFFVLKVTVLLALVVYLEPVKRRAISVLAGLLLASIAAMTSHFSFISLGFYLNQDAIASEHCINKDSPESNCQGKCFLSKQLDDAHQHDRQLNLQSDFLQLMQTLPAEQALFVAEIEHTGACIFAPAELPFYQDPDLKRYLRPPRV